MGSVRLAVLLAAFAVLSTESFAGSHRRPFRSIKAPKETVVNYETVTPVVTYKDSQQVHPRKLHVRVPTRNADYSLVLEQNEAILSGGFTSRHYDEQGKEVVTKGHVNCFYQGWVEDHPDWRVTMSTCHGLQGSFGDMNDENSFFHLEPLNTESSSMDQLHAFYLDSEYKQKQGSCGSNHSHALNEPLFGTDLDIIRHSNHSRLRRQSSSRYVEWAVVNDNRQYIANGRNLSATVLRSISIANEIDQLYRALSIRIVLTDAITWTNGDRISISPNPETLLNTFRSQQRNVISSSYDNAMLITGIDLTGSTVGIAFIGTMCSSTSSVGVTQDGGRSLSSVASTAAHEMGHNFNMNHDETTRQCTCTDGNQGCIMAAISGFPPPTRWSSCSISDLNEGFTTRNTGRCLSNIPTTMVGDPVCGNGIREGNEICDCGSEQECTDPCCNAATCQLASGAQCSAGPCCSSTCQFLSYGSQCRAAIGECDIAEYCPGDSADCPSDEYLHDGASCGGSAGYCFEGRCPTHNDQCQRAFGSNKGVDSCYDLNVQGDQDGNCGQANNTFLPCTENNVECGQLQCMSGDFQANVGVDIIHSTSNQSGVSCRSFTTLPGSNVDTQAPGLVEDGTRCGDGLVCLSQQCVPLSTIAVSLSCGTSGTVCSGNGVCNNNGECSCDVGFVGSSCENPFSGPTASNGSGSGDGLLTGVATVVGVVLFLLVITTIIVFFITLNVRRSLSKPNGSGIKSHFSVEYHTTKQGFDTVSEDFLPNEPKKKVVSKVDLSLASSGCEDVEFVPVRPAPQRPPSETPPPVALDLSSVQLDIHSEEDKLTSLDLSEVKTDICPPPPKSDIDITLTAAELPSHTTTAVSKDEEPSEGITQPPPPTGSKPAITMGAAKPQRPPRRPPPMTPPKAEKPVTAPRHNAPIKPQPASRPAPAPKPAPVSVSSHEVSAPKPKPKPKPVVPAEKPPVGAVPPKPAVKPAVIDTQQEKPKFAIPKPPMSTAPKPSKDTPPTEGDSTPTTSISIKPSVRTASKPSVPTVPKASVPTTSMQLEDTVSAPVDPKPSVTTAPKPSVATSPKPSVPTAPKATSPKPSVSTAPKPSLTPKQPEEMVSKPSAPVAPKPSIPTAPKPSVPTAPKPSVPTAPKPSIPTAPKPSVPTAPKPSVPMPPKPSGVTASKPSAPVTPKPKSPKPSIPVALKTSVPSSPNSPGVTSSKPSASLAPKPMGPKPLLPTTPKPSVPITPKPSIPTSKPAVAPRSTVPPVSQSSVISQKPTPPP